MKLEAYCKQLEQRIAELEKENARLRKRLGIPVSTGEGAVPPKACTDDTIPGKAAGIHKYSSPNEKIQLFRSLFRGREDVFARRWYSVQKEKGGYSPVCANEWKYGVCMKPKGSCSKCEHRELVPLNDGVIYDHLSGKDPYGKDVVGLYPILPDDTCFFLAIDFDDGDWREYVTVVRKICQAWEIPCAVERSRSGEGAHLWIFFTQSVPCTLARALGTALLTEAMERSGSIKLDSYDRMFPNQDTLPKGGFGNLIALPLQGQARRRGNSSFIDEQFRMYPDQWAYLAQIRKISPEEDENVIKLHSKGDGLGNLCSSEEEPKPWEKRKSPALAAMDFQNTLEIVRANMLYIRAEELTPRAQNQLLRLAAFRNPDFYRAQAMRLPIYNKPRILCTAEERAGYLALPRGCEPSLTELLDKAGAGYKISDKTNAGRPICVQFKGSLRPEQQSAADALLKHKIGVLSAATGFGKTVIAAYLIAQRKVNTLVLVHTQALLNQWKDSLTEFLEIAETLPEQPKRRGRKKECALIGQLGGAKNTISGFVDIAIMQSLISGDEVRELVKDYGMVIVDECHHVSAVSFERILKEVSARYVYGLTATPVRQDGHQPIIHMQCGPIRYCVDAKSQAEKQAFDHYLIPRFTAYRSASMDKGIASLYADLTANEMRKRNQSTQRTLFWENKEEGFYAFLETMDESVDLVAIAESVGPGEIMEVSKSYLGPDFTIELEQEPATFIEWQSVYPQKIPVGYELEYVGDPAYGQQSIEWKNHQGDLISYTLYFRLGRYGREFEGSGEPEAVSINGHTGYKTGNSLLWTDEELGFAYDLRVTGDVDLITLAQSVAPGPELPVTNSNFTAKALEQLGDYRITALPDNMIEDGLSGVPLEGEDDWYSYVRRWYYDKTDNDQVYFTYETYVTECSTEEEVLRLCVSGMTEPEFVTIHGYPGITLQDGDRAYVAWMNGDVSKGVSFQLFSEQYTVEELLKMANSVQKW